MNDSGRSLQARDQSLSGVIGAGPGLFWVTCSDSLVNPFDPARDRSGLVHSNPGNLALPTDISFLASLKMALETYNISEIIVCGHYGCRSIEAAASGSRSEILGDWLAPVRAIAGNYSDMQPATPEPRPFADVLTELNVIEQAKNVRRTSLMRDAWDSGRQIAIRGMIFDPIGRARVTERTQYHVGEVVDSD